MGNLLAYSGTTAKIRAIRSRLLTDDDYEELASSKNVPAALAFLKKHPGYSDLFEKMEDGTLHRGNIERILTNAIYIDFQKIYRFAPVEQRRFLDLYFHRYEIAILKSCLRMVFDHRDVTLDLRIFEDFFQKHSDIPLRDLSTSQTVDEFVANLKGSAYHPILEKLTFLNNPTLWDYEMAIDLYYFKWFWKEGNKIFNKKQLHHFKEAYGTKIDLLNVRWIYRSKQYFKMPDAHIYAHLIPVQYHLKTNDINALVEASGKEEFNLVLKKTYYGRRYSEYSADTLDTSYSAIRHDIQRKAAKQDPYSAATVISYLFEKDREIDNVTTVLEGVRYGLPKNEVMEYIKH